MNKKNVYCLKCNEKLTHPEAVFGFCSKNCMDEYDQEKQIKGSTPVSGSLLQEIRDEMDADMEDSGMAQGEIESCLNHWGNKYVILRR